MIWKLLIVFVVDLVCVAGLLQALLLFTPQKIREIEAGVQSLAVYRLVRECLWKVWRFRSHECVCGACRQNNDAASLALVAFGRKVPECRPAQPSRLH